VDQDRISEYFTGIKSTCELRTALSVNNFRIEHSTGSNMCEFLIMSARSHTAEYTKAQVAFFHPRHNFRRNPFIVIFQTDACEPNKPFLDYLPSVGESPQKLAESRPIIWA
jgi:hypothetical protein